MPGSIISRSRSVLKSLEDRIGNHDLKIPEKVKEPDNFLFNDSEVVIDEIKSIDINNLTPMEALRKLDSWKKIL